MIAKPATAHPRNFECSGQTIASTARGAEAAVRGAVLRVAVAGRLSKAGRGRPGGGRRVGYCGVEGTAGRNAGRPSP